MYNVKKGWMYILECSNGAYYTGSTNNIELRMQQHQSGNGANFTKKHLPVHLVYSEEFERVQDAFYREKQIQGWSRKKKEALINGFPEKLHELAECKNETHFKNAPFGSVQEATFSSLSEAETNVTIKETETNIMKSEVETNIIKNAPFDFAQGATPSSLSEAETNLIKNEVETNIIKNAPFDFAQGATPSSLSEVETNIIKSEVETNIIKSEVKTNKNLRK